MKLKLFALVLSLAIVATLFAGCNSDTSTTKTPDESTPQVDNPQVANSAESKSFAQEKIEEAGFKVAKSDDALPTMESVPEGARELANSPKGIANALATMGVISWDENRELEKLLREHQELCPQLAILIDEACDGGYITDASEESIKIIDAFGKQYGLWT